MAAALRFPDAGVGEVFAWDGLGTPPVPLGRASGLVSVEARGIVVKVDTQVHDLGFLRDLGDVPLALVLEGAGPAQPTALRAVPRLESITLHGPAFGPSALEALRESAALQHISVRDTGITPAHIAAFAATNKQLNMRVLELHYAGFAQEGSDDDAVVTIIRDWPSLEMLSLGGANVSDAILGAVQGLPSLEFLSVTNCALTGAKIGSLKANPALRRVALQGTHVGDEAASALAELSQIEKLYLGKTNITDASSAALLSSTIPFILCGGLSYESRIKLRDRAIAAGFSYPPVRDPAAPVPQPFQLAE